MKSSSEIRDVKNPTKCSRRVHIANTKAEDRKKHSDYGTGKNCDLEIENEKIISLNILFKGRIIVINCFESLTHKNLNIGF